ncbi:hypothetical protein [Streptomyces sp. SID4956]|uniref:hypothetical protein n=1 Tax=Streptomyces sp. SID4956 TaxID=2690290 RepID=UPI001F3B1599
MQDEFVRTVADFGGVPWHFVNGTMNYINSASSDWEENSRATVQEADVCVFVIVEEIGHITWGTEVTAALLAGKPFLVLCQQSTYERYLVLNAEFRPPASLDSLEEGTRNLVTTLREIEQDRRLTAVPFGHGKFGETLRRELSKLFDIALGQMEERNRRKSILPLLSDPARLTTKDLRTAQAIAVDEWEDKQARKAALRALAARRTLDEDALYSLLASGEQGVQRMTVELLPELYPVRPPETGTAGARGGPGQRLRRCGHPPAAHPRHAGHGPVERSGGAGSSRDGGLGKQAPPGPGVGAARGRRRPSRAAVSCRGAAEALSLPDRRIGLEGPLPGLSRPPGSRCCGGCSR